MMMMMMMMMTMMMMIIIIIMIIIIGSIPAHDTESTAECHQLSYVRRQGGGRYAMLSLYVRMCGWVCGWVDGWMGVVCAG